MTETGILIIALLGTLILVLGGLAILYYKRSVHYRKRVRKATDERDNFSRIIQKSNDALFLIDTVNGSILQVNEMGGQLLGYKARELLNMTIFDLYPKEKLNRSAEVIAETWEQGGLVFQDLPMIAQNGEVIDMECSARVVPFGAHPTILIFARDIRERLRLQREIEAKNAELETKNADITDSIIYARRIQQAILPSLAEIEAAFPQSFVLYRPKDIVSGDFYYYVNSGEWHILAVADCTGHGVPGAFMSMLGTSLLRKIVLAYGETDPGRILTLLNDEVNQALSKAGGGEHSIKDGMDIGLVAYHPGQNTLAFAGAMRNLVYLPATPAPDSNGIQVIKADRQSIGGGTAEGGNETFQTHARQPAAGDQIYLYSDGYPDQFGGPKGKKFMEKRLRRTLKAESHQPIAEQQRALTRHLDEWMGGQYKQVDDILLAGIRF